MRSTATSLNINAEDEDNGLLEMTACGRKQTIRFCPKWLEERTSAKR